MFTWLLWEYDVYKEEDNIVEGWCLNGHDFLTADNLNKLDVVCDLFLGPAEEISSSVPVIDLNNLGCLKGGTAFEWCGQQLVKDFSQSLVRPAGAGKFYRELDNTDDYSLNLKIRGKITKINAHIAMTAPKIKAPKDYMQLLKEYADANTVPTVALQDALEKGLESLIGFF
ncbi:hypothetical protein BYT27DRAFT_7212959 [Phlegmacium glaucopus]|nr:hypothetical protein BYT27DRAFT_7212959 [Phlegmacium glaucopus]